MARCSRCGGNESTRDDARGETVCTTCGAVLQSGAMVDSISFAGGGKMTGQFIDMATGQARGFPGRYAMRESRELSLARGFSNVDRIAYKLHLPQPIVEGSKRLYTSAFGRNFTQGRPNLYVASACLYAICRKQSSAHMLIDFSDALRTPVKVLAQTFMKLIRALTLAVPTVDPSLFMERFAGDMKLGDITNKVANTGVRIVQAMKRDWICTGRRPLGLCAASLLIAARYHGHKVNAEDIDELFRMSTSTIEKRVQEFGTTAAAQLRIKDFETVDLETLPILHGPPCLTNRKRKFAALEDAEYANEELLALEDIGQGVHKPAAKTSKLPEELPAEEEEVPDIESSAKLAGTIDLTVKPKELCRSDLDHNDVASVAGKMVTAIGKAAEGIGDTQEDGLSEVISSVAKAAPEIAEFMQTLEDVEEPLDDIPDEAVDSFFLTPTEQDEKALIWDDINKDIMPRVYERQVARRERLGRSTSTRIKRKKEPLGPADDPASSVLAALTLGGDKVNTDVLNDLFG